ncbi:uncharacterized protein N7483_009763 [Penicillium malachiteum]|uniref:uncharacterized protein n=1 Tax=Penicillium malachiteum TaxID=1324776 RepID=UPI0025472498|nr:uncharacterized protein N7483_009763 [Penicillium malachiteum]KAJ5721829.1 hypothetical protein N7483_009763 [Penicillium malachiteum]
MPQRGKVLDTDGPTPKFLYAMLKQLDLKTIDWNRVAVDIQISNGHAARMRFSRFRNQMEGTTGAQRAAKKKNAKGKKGDKCDMSESNGQMLAIMPGTQSAPGIKMEPGDFMPYANPIKCEGNQQHHGSQNFADLPDMYSWSHQPNSSSVNGTPFHLQMHPFMQPGMPYSVMSGISSSSSSMTPVSPPGFYPQFGMHDFNLPEIGVQQSAFPNAPVLSWEPPASPQPQPQLQPEAQPGTQPPANEVKIEENSETTNTAIKIEPYQLE